MSDQGQQPGYYPDPQTGQPRWWDGRAWGQFAPPGNVLVAPAPAKKSHVLRNVLIVLVVLFVLFIGGCAALIGSTGKALEEASEEIEARDTAIQREASLDGACSIDAIGFVIGKGRVTNGSSEPSNYIVEVKVSDGDLRIGTAYGSANSVSPRATAEFNIAGVPADGHTQVSCEIVDVTRFAAP